MPPERVQNSAIGGFPHFDLMIQTAGDDALAIRRKRNRQYRPAVPDKCAQFIAVGGVPHPGGLIPTAADNALAVRRKATAQTGLWPEKVSKIVLVTASQTFAAYPDCQ